MKNFLDQLKTHKKQAIATGAGIIGLCLALVLIVVGFPAMPDTGTDNNWNQNALEATTSTDSDNNKDQVTTKNNQQKEKTLGSAENNKDKQATSAASSHSSNSKQDGSSSNKQSSTNKKAAGTSASKSDDSNNAGNSSHTHTWQDHTASRQVWVSNMVTVPDYETQTIRGGQLYTQHSDGNWYSDGETYWFYTDADYDAFKSLIIEKMRNEGYIGNYVNRSKTEKVQVGSHQEDHGSYKTETYVDYQYCACGAKK